MFRFPPRLGDRCRYHAYLSPMVDQADKRISFSIQFMLWLVACICCFLVGWILPQPQELVDEYLWKKHLKPTGIVVSVSEDGGEISLGYADGVYLGRRVAIFRDDERICTCRVVGMRSNDSQIYVAPAEILQKGDLVALCP